MSNNLRMFRGKLGLSQKDLAEKLDVTRITINNVENGKSCFARSTIEKACNIFGCTPIDLMGEDCLKIVPENDVERLKLINLIVKSFDDESLQILYEDLYNEKIRSS